jgi:hypothetical protein
MIEKNYEVRPAINMRRREFGVWSVWKTVSAWTDWNGGRRKNSGIRRKVTRRQACFLATSAPCWPSLTLYSQYHALPRCRSIGRQTVR